MLDEVHVKVEPLETDVDMTAMTTQMIPQIIPSNHSRSQRTETRNNIALNAKELLMAALDPVCFSINKRRTELSH